MSFIAISLLKLLAVAGSSYLIYKSICIYLLRKKYRHIPGPPANGILGFFLGSVVDMPRYMKNKKTYNDFLFDCHEKYGQVFKMQFFSEIYIVTNEKTAIREVLVVKNLPKPSKSIQNAAFPLGTRYLGHGLVSELDQNKWKSRREIFNKGFHRNVLMSFANQFNMKGDLLMEKLRSLADGRTVIDLFDEFNYATLDAISLIAFGINIDSINKSDNEIKTALRNSASILKEAIFDPLFNLKPSRSQKVKSFANAINQLRAMAKNIISERLTQIKNNEHTNPDILSCILDSWKGDSFDMEVMIDDFLTIYSAGQETTAVALSFSFYELAKNEEIFSKARDEVDRVIGEKNDITYQDVSELKYCSAVFKESLRLYPPAPVLGRETHDEMEILGYNIPKNSPIFISIYASGRNPNNFANPLEFNPERFMKDSALSNFENYSYFPFSLGPRICIGQNFAHIESIILMAKFIQKFDLKLVPDYEFQVLEEFTLKPKGGVRVCLSLRE